MAAAIRAAVRKVVTGMRPITDRQDQREHHRRLLAYSRDYTVAARWGRVHTAASATLAVVPYAFAVVGVESPPVVGAVAAGYLVLARTVLRGAQRGRQRRAAVVQEKYDIGLFQIPWNAAIAGATPSEDDVEGSAEAFLGSRLYRRDPTAYDRWYTVDLAGVPWPADGLLCQRQSAVWSRRDHFAYSRLLYAGFVALVAVSLVFGVVKDMNLAEYLVLLFLPTAPAALDLVELAQRHTALATARQRLEDDIDEAWTAHESNPADVPVETVRRLQDAAFVLRRDGERVPQYFYKLRRRRAELVTKLGTESLRRGA